MTIFVESLKRLFKNGKVGLFKLKELKENGKLSDEEFNYIVKQSDSENNVE